MSKKELLERIARVPEARPKKVEVSPVAAGDAVTTRVSGRVVRRRARNEPDSPAPEAVPVRRRAALELAPTREADGRASTPAGAPARTGDAPPRGAEAPGRGDTPVPTAQRPRDADAPVAAQAEPERQPEPVAPPPLVRIEPDASVDPDAPPPAPAPEPVSDRASPRFQRLGKAVVSPPPGYDPNAPRRAPVPAARPAAAPATDDLAFRRRRVEADEAAGSDGRGRRTRTAMDGGAMAAAMRRRQRRKPGVAVKPPSEKKASKRKVRVDGTISVAQLAHEMGLKATLVIKELMGMGRMATVNEMLDVDTAALVASAFEYEVVNSGFQETEYLQQVSDAVEEEGQESRPPIVTIMGHVDHGKTTLLDAIREARVAAGEAGGITQHIGAYQADVGAQKVTFIDTPGHAAFTAMRARGASLTDIVVLVVAADDGVQAQTEEAISHARAAGVPIVVAVNKMDKPGVNADPIKQKLSDIGLVPEDWGGDTMFVPVSALKKQGLDELLEAILLQAEVLELRANPARHAEGVVIESRVERGKGPVASLLVQKGTLSRGDNIVLGAVSGRIRAMVDHTGRPVKEAGPSAPVEISGLSDLPEVGDTFSVVKSAEDAKTLAEHRAREKRDSSFSTGGRRTAADLFAQAGAEDKKVLTLVLKADVQGSLEALKAALVGIEVAATELRILHAQVGDVSESDIGLASANGALLIGFNVRMDSMARQAAEQLGKKPEMYDIIYAVVDRVKALMSGLHGPVYQEVRQGEAEVRAVFQISKIGRIAGCYVTDGKIVRGHGIRVFRNDQKLHEGKINTLKRFKDDAREVAAGYECGIGIEGFDGVEVGDRLETFSQEEVSAA